MLTRQKLQNDSTIFMAITLTLIAVGIIFIYSSSAFFALEKHGSSFYFVKKQLLGIFLGGFFFYCAQNFPLEFLKRLSIPLMICAIILTGLPTFTPLHVTIHGSSRWLTLFGVSFQPSELLKVALVIYLASFLSRKKEHLQSFKKGYLPLLTILGISALILLQQPDFGCLVTLAATTLIMMFLANVNMKYLFITGITALPLGGLLIFLQPYRLKRVLTYLNPWEDPKGAGFQIIQSLIAIGSGGLLGTGVGQSKQKFFYLPMQHTDFIFAIIAEETGFLGSSLLIMLYMLFAYFGFKISWQLKDKFSAFLVQGIIVIISIQTLINLMVTIGLAPTKGIGLPFISYGNTALACQMMMIGLIINAASDFYE